MPASYLLFDLGNVLVQLNGLPWLRNLWPDCDESAIHRRWMALEQTTAFECGQMEPATFFAEMPAALGADISPASFEQLFDDWVVGEYKGASELLRCLRGTYRVGCLSNTSISHMEKLRRVSPLLDQFDDCFFSYELGCMKPSPEIYELVQAKLDRPADDIWFFDDNAANITAAARHGWRTSCVHGLDAVKAALATSLAGK